MSDVSQWKDRWDKNYEFGYASKIPNTPAVDMPMHWYFSNYLFPSWRHLTNKDSVLEIGCGNGAIAVRVFGKAKRFVGTDISEEAIEMIRKRFRKIENVRFEATTDVLSLGETFDMIYAITVFQHIPKEFTKKYIEDCKKILKPGGVLFFNVLSGMQDKNVADIEQEINGICEPNMGFSKEEIEKVCQEAGFDSVLTLRMEVDNPTDKYWWLWTLCR